MTNDHALESLELTKTQLGIEVPMQLLAQILEIENRYAFDIEEASRALREIESLIDTHLRGGETS